MKNSNIRPKSILFLAPYPMGVAPSQRFRFEQYLHFLEANGISYVFSSFWSLGDWKLIYSKGNHLKKAFSTLLAFSRRIFMLRNIPLYNLIFIHREVTPIGPPFMEWIIRFVFRKRIIYDFDDAIWLENTSEQNRWIAWLKFHQKTGWICHWSSKVSVGNSFLQSYAQQFNSNVIFNPTTIDTQYHQRQYNSQTKTQISIGWTGTHSTAFYLEPLMPVLEKLTQKYSVDFIFISNLPLEKEYSFVRFIPWKKESEMEDLSSIDIGIMPLPDVQWARGKCGFKILQYMALGIPAVASPVGVNVDILSDGVNGFLCKDHVEWEQKLSLLIENEELRKRFGANGKLTVEEKYSVEANRGNFLSIVSKI